MANIYVRSTDGDNSDNGSTWALAKQTLGGAATVDVGGDTVYISQNHSESTAGSISVNFADSSGPVRILCANDGAAPPTALATSALVVTTGSGSISIAKGSAAVTLYIYGITFRTGTGAGVGGFFAAECHLENCRIEFPTTYASGSIGMSKGAEFVNCVLKFGSASQSISCGDSDSPSIIRGGSVDGSGSTPNALFSGGYMTMIMEGVDLSALASTVSIFQGFSVTNVTVMARNCKLPASWSGALLYGSAVMLGNAAIRMVNCDSGDTNYRLWIEKLRGSIRDESTLVRTGGASDGATALSWKMTSNGGVDAVFINPLESDEIIGWNETVGSSITVSIEILHDSATNLKDDEIWLEVQYLGTSGFPLGSFISDAKADVLATAADQASSSETWTTTGMSNPNKQKLSVTFTPQEKGFIHAVVKVAKASYTVYVCPKLTVA